MEFETIGYFLEYSIDNKFIGCINIDSPDRDSIGWASAEKGIATENIVLSNGKRIKKGQEYITRLYPLNGRIKKKQ